MLIRQTFTGSLGFALPIQLAVLLRIRYVELQKEYDGQLQLHTSSQNLWLVRHHTHLNPLGAQKR